MDDSMQDQQIIKIKDFICNRFGIDSLVPYGSGLDEPHHISFEIKSIPASYSVLTQDGKIDGDFVDVQIESNPQGDYLVVGVVSVNRFLKLIIRMSQLPKDKWPESFEEFK